MSGIRWTTGIGIAVGGVGGALAALMGAPTAPRPQPVEPAEHARPRAAAPPTAAAPLTAAAMSSSTPAPTIDGSSAPSASAPLPDGSSAPSASAPLPAPGPAVTVAVPPLAAPPTLEGLLNAEVLCDRKKSYDDCTRAALALEQGSAGPADALQAKRFRRIALTYLVSACEVGDPHACFIMAEKYRSGAELTASPVRAAALQQRGIELCRLRRAAECPPP